MRTKLKSVPVASATAFNSVCRVSGILRGARSYMAMVWPVYDASTPKVVVNLHHDLNTGFISLTTVTLVIINDLYITLVCSCVCRVSSKAICPAWQHQYRKLVQYNERCGNLGVLMSIPRALYWTLNHGNSAKHQLYREVAVEETRKGLKYIMSRSPFFMVCLLLGLRPLLMSKAAGAMWNGGSAKSRPSAAGRTWAVDCLNLTVV